MTGSTGPGFDVDPSALETHRGKLDALTGRINTALNAAEQTMHPEAFGIIGMSLAISFSMAQSVAEDAVRTAATSADDHADRVRVWQQRKEITEDEYKKLFKV
ncbi:hypothetical protein DMC61_01795 [Amycolatopsis sp. WAC 04169]|uniref:type VII secretion target n=1 Tax=Amycolatopsis TaxID=1813 RepID=UPI0008796D59|nr:MULTISPECIES: type VII secretion target [Amycolatopsis]OLZ59939.1 hypothetical protein BS330_06220 [Amycolatopsis keratiniphila subsp. nogabecina]RSN36841.1 hypothetical protein DMC61_01795 [Amycolatopsis sp. WAC 04169]SDU56423.1 Excreted virulence factor EspC, type VII ESX diderm [Amycolatopsis keratiniphila]